MNIGDAPSLPHSLLSLEQKLKCPIYFVLGNHDYYYSSIADVRNQVQKITKNSSYLHYLPNTGAVKLTFNTCLLGHDSWSDGRYGNYFNSEIMLNDYSLIEDFSQLDKQSRWQKLKQLGDEAADYFKVQLNQAFLVYQHVLVLTHVPPFIEACWHEGNLSNDDFLPHFCCKATGEVFINLMRKYPDKNLTILCGHTHSGGMCHILPNLFVKSGSADYGQPTAQDPIIIK